MKNSFGGLIDNIYQVHDVLQGCAAKSINQLLTIRNWIFGYYIVEYEQNGDDRARYGEKLLEEISQKLSHIKGLRFRQLYVCKDFYLTYPNFLRTVSVKLQSLNLGQSEILRTLSAKLQSTDNESSPILRSVTAKLENSIRGTLSPELLDGDKLHPALLLSRLNFSHFIELIRISDPLQRLFYEVETIKNNWSVRELKRAITTQLAFRTTMSTNKEAIIAKIKNLKPATNAEIIRNPIVCIRVDIVFYHRILKCHVLIDLKVHEFDHADAGQMNLYLNYYKANEMSEGDNPPVGIILCADKDDTLVEYSIAGMDDHLFVSKYLVNLPQKNVLEEFIKREMGL